jgi:SAM-dependent methyltransferase
MDEFSYARYLLAKRTVDDRALNKNVLERLRNELLQRTSLFRVLEIGAGLGTMVARLEEWKILDQVEYTCLDANPEFARAGREWLVNWATVRGYTCREELERLHIHNKTTNLSISFVTRELSEYLRNASRAKVDLLIANAFLDLVDVPALLPDLLGTLEVGGLYWFSINFDGETILLPELPEDEALMRVYHRSMDERVRFGSKAGDSKTGRRLFRHLRGAGATVLAAGSSDWLVHSQSETRDYIADEAYFLNCILLTIDTELRMHKDVDAEVLAKWIQLRKDQVSAGELVLIVHQLDFLGRSMAQQSC